VRCTEGLMPPPSRGRSIVRRQAMLQPNAVQIACEKVWSQPLLGVKAISCPMAARDRLARLDQDDMATGIAEVPEDPRRMTVGETSAASRPQRKPRSSVSSFGGGIRARFTRHDPAEPVAERAALHGALIADEHTVPNPMASRQGRPESGSPRARRSASARSRTRRRGGGAPRPGRAQQSAAAMATSPTAATPAAKSSSSLACPVPSPRACGDAFLEAAGPH
jgi:hypothetical protein